MTATRDARIFKGKDMTGKHKVEAEIMWPRDAHWSVDSGDHWQRGVKERATLPTYITYAICVTMVPREVETRPALSRKR